MPDYEVRRADSVRSPDEGDPGMARRPGRLVPLGELPLFEDEFDYVTIDLSEPSPDEEGDEAPRERKEAAPAVMPAGKPAFLRRFWARWLDLHLYAAAWWWAMWWAGRDIGGALNDLWTMVPMYVPWFVLEAWLVHRFGATPGKWLLGLSVRQADGSRLPLGQSLRRAVRVMFAGVGLGYNPLSIFCQGLSLFTARRLGSPLWDHLGGHVVDAAPLRPLRVISLVVFYITALNLQMAITYPYLIERTGEVFPGLKERMEENPPWHMPKR
jgi:uncharacterized RDD family membrane protein YckC